MNSGFWLMFGVLTEIWAINFCLEPNSDKSCKSMASFKSSKPVNNLNKICITLVNGFVRRPCNKTGCPTNLVFSHFIRFLKFWHLWKCRLTILYSKGWERNGKVSKWDSRHFRYLNNTLKVKGYIDKVVNPTIYDQIEYENHYEIFFLLKDIIKNLNHILFQFSFKGKSPIFPGLKKV